MNQKVAEKKAVAQAATAELATYRKVQATMTKKMLGKIDILMAEQDLGQVLAQAATSSAVTETESADMSDVPDSPASSPQAVLATRTALTPPQAATLAKRSLLL